MTHLRKFAAAVAIVAMGLTIAGCGDDEPEAAATSPSTEAPATTATDPAPTTTVAAEVPPPCELVTKAEAEALLPGATLLDGVESGQGDNVSCTYSGDPNGPTAQVEVFVGAGAKKSLDIDKDALAHEFTQPTGIGDEAWLEADNIFFRTGDTWVQLRVVTLDLSPEAIAANLTAAASAVAAKLA